MIGAAVWLWIAGLVLIFEGIAIVQRGGMLSHYVWIMLDDPRGRMLLVPLWAWLTWHWFLEHWAWPAGKPEWWDDLVVIASALAGMILARLARRSARNRRDDIDG